MKAPSLQLVPGRLSVNAPARDELDWREDLEDYLDCMTAVLVGHVPYAERQRLRDEARDHLICLTQEEASQGTEGPSAFRTAVRSYGESHTVARQYLESWFKKKAQGPLARRIGLDSLVGIGWMAAAQIVCFALALANTLLPGTSSLRYVIDPQAFYSVLPQTLPAPEVSPLHLLMALAWTGSPLAAGWMIGKGVPVGSGMAAMKGVGLCMAYSLLAGLLMLPSTDLLGLAVVQAGWWLPVSAFVAHVSSAFAWKRKCRWRGGQK